MAAVNFSMFAGDTKVLQVTVYNNGSTSPVDITGTAIRWELSKHVNALPPLIAKAVGTGITIVDGPAGRFDVRLDPPDTEPLNGSYYYEAEVDDAGIISTILTGMAQIMPTLIDPP